MSYNIDDVTCLKIDAWMSIKDLRRIAATLRPNQLPECSFFTDAQRQLREHDAAGLMDLSSSEGRIEIKNLHWYGEGSGHTFDTLKKEIAPFIHGHVEAVFTWEGGDSHSGLIIHDGEVTDCDVEFKLVPKAKVKARQR